MKIIIYITLLFFFYTSVKAQQNTNFYVYNQSQDTIIFSKISNIPIEYEMTNHNDTISIHNNDTVSIHNLELEPLQYDSLLILDSIQIDGIGAKEIFFCRKMKYFESVHGGTFDGMEYTNIEIIEIWNLDTKEQYWEAVTFYSANFVGSYNREGRILFKYDFTIDSSGNIEISKKFAVKTESNYDGNSNSKAYKIIPELKTGKYYFENGEYIIKQ